MADIKVSSTSLREKAASFKSIADSIRNYTEDMKKTVDNLRSTWEGTASENTRSAFNKFQATFDEKYETIIRFAEFLEATADEYEKTENANAQI